MHWLGAAITTFQSLFLGLVCLIYMFVFEGVKNPVVSVSPAIIVGLVAIPAAAIILQLLSEPVETVRKSVKKSVAVTLTGFGAACGFLGFVGAMIGIFVLQPMDLVLVGVSASVGFVFMAVLILLGSRGSVDVKPNLFRWIAITTLAVMTWPYLTLGLVLLFATPDGIVRQDWASLAFALYALSGPFFWLIVRERVAARKPRNDVAVE